jgi:hypothetical protein
VLLKVNAVEPVILFMEIVNSVAFAGSVTGDIFAHTTMIFARVGLMGVEVMLIPARAEFAVPLEKVALVGSYSILNVMAETLTKPFTVRGMATLDPGQATLAAAVVTGAFLAANEFTPKKSSKRPNEKLNNLTTVSFRIENIILNFSAKIA